MSRYWALCLAALLWRTTVPVSFNTPREVQNVASSSNLRSLRIISWNIDRGSHLNHIVGEIKTQPADLYLLQEVDWGTARVGNLDVGAELARRLHLNMDYGIEFEELSQEEQGHPAYTGQATLTQLPIKHSRILRFQNQSDFWRPRSWIPSTLPLLQRRTGGRIALVTDLEFAGQLLVVYNAHLESRSYGRLQMRQLEEILADLKGHYPPGTSAIIGGDLNTKYLPSVFLHKMEREGFHSATGSHIERSTIIAMALDWIFVRGPVQWEQGTVRRNWKGSDHYPVCAELVATR